MNRSQAAVLLTEVLRGDPSSRAWVAFENLSREESDLFLRETVRHRLAGVLYRHLLAHNSHSDNLYPIKNELRDVAMRICARNLDLFNALHRVLERLEEYGYSAVALKGLHLTSEVYADYAARPMIDLDLLVKASDHLDAARILGSIGFHSVGIAHLDQWHADPQRRHLHLSDGRVPLELHRSFVPTLLAESPEMAAVLSRADRVTLGGRSCLVLCPEDLLLHLCTHASLQDAFGSGLLPCFDVANTIDRYRERLDWSAVVERARRWQADRGVLLVLALARELAGADVPSWVLDSLSPAGGYEAQLVPARHRTCVLPEQGTLPSSTLARMVGPESRRTKLRLLLQSIFPDRDVIRKRYPRRSRGPWLPVGYLRHFSALLRHHGGSAWRLLRGKQETVETAGVINDGYLLQAWLAGGEPRE